MWLSVDPLAEKFPNVSPYAYVFQNPVKFIDPTGMLPEDSDNDPDPPTGKRDIYDSTPTKDGGRKLTRIKTVSSGSDQNDAFVNVVDKDGNSLKAYSGANAVAEYTRDYGLYKEFESIASDGMGDFERAFWSTKEVIKIAATDPETQPILLLPAGALADILMTGSVTASYSVITTKNLGWATIKAGGLEAELSSTMSGKTMTQVVEYVGATQYRAEAKAFIKALEGYAKNQGANKLIIQGNNIVTSQGLGTIKHLQKAGYTMESFGGNTFRAVKKLK